MGAVQAHTVLTNLLRPQTETRRGARNVSVESCPVAVRRVGSAREVLRLGAGRPLRRPRSESNFGRRRGRRPLWAREGSGDPWRTGLDRGLVPLVGCQGSARSPRAKHETGARRSSPDTRARHRRCHACRGEGGDPVFPSRSPSGFVGSRRRPWRSGKRQLPCTWHLVPAWALSAALPGRGGAYVRDTIR
jgi:hypothetical protein